MTTKLLAFTPKDLKELFALFSSPAQAELAMVYNPEHDLFFENEDLDKEYELTQERREYSLDAARAVLYWLRQHGFAVVKSEEVDDLSWVEDELFM